MTIRHDIYEEINKYLFVIERQKARCQSDLGVLTKANKIINNEERSCKKGWREEVLLRDHFTCQRCGYTEELTAHHIIPKSICNEDMKYVTSNGITLCQACHNEWHNKHDNGVGLHVFINWLTSSK